MKALITTNYIYTHLSYDTKQQYEQHKIWENWILSNQGKWVDIDTNCIFDNQYNTVDGFRIYDTHIDEICDDIRTDTDIFFVKHPNGKDQIKKVDFKDHLKNERFMSCYSVNGNYYRISRRSNIEFVLVGSEILITNGIGYTPLKKARLTANEQTIVGYCAEKIISL